MVLKKKNDNNTSDRAKLYVVATPIGNLEDITYRALRTLREVDFIAAEDTRQLKKLLNKFEISKPHCSYHKFSEKKNAGFLLEKIMSGQNLALVSDAGVPLISDPGQEIVRLCIENGVDVVPIPGACSIETALVGTGFDTSGFIFLGFLPKKPSKRRKVLAPYAGDDKLLVIFESPYRIYKLLDDVSQVLGNRRVAVCRELTKIHEEFIRGRVDDVKACERVLKGEIVVVIDGADECSLESLVTEETAQDQE